MSEQEEVFQKQEEPIKKVESKKENKFGVDKVVLTVSLVGLVIVSGLWAKDRGVFNKTSSGISGNKNGVKVELYVMSQCPYGVQAEDAMKPVIDKIGKDINFNINYIADEDGKGGFSSLHGEKEVKGDIVQLCAKKYDAEKYFDMIICQNKDSANVDTNWEACANEVKLSNIDKVKACSTNQEGKALLTENIKLAKAASVSGSPTYYINGKQYQGNRDEGSIIKEICKADSKIAACKSLPVCFTDNDCSDNVAKIGRCIDAGKKTVRCEYFDPKPVTLTVLNDKRNADGASIEAQITDSLKQIFKGLQVKILDYSDAEGKKIASTIPGIKLPAYLFGADVKDGEGYANVQSYLSEQGGYQLLAVGSQFDPTKEICDNKIDDNGNGKIDCADLECSGSTVCRKEISKKLDLFVMADCPYGNTAEDAMKEVLANFGKNINLNINYIASKNADGTFTSLHGDYEVKEDKVELCVNKYFPLKNFEFVTCMNTKGVKTTDWKTCATEVGFATAKVSTCAEGAEGSYLLAQNIKIAESLGVSASPTWLVNNKYQGPALDAESIKTLFCKYNVGVAGCEKTLTSDSQATAAASAGAGCAAAQ